MPDAGQWLLLAGIGLPVAAAVAWPLVRPQHTVIFDSTSEAEARTLRHRVAIDALMDVEADRRAGSLDDASYQRELAAAEAHAAQTLEELGASPNPMMTLSPVANLTPMIGWLAAAVAVLLVIAFALPGPNGLGERTIVNQALADQLKQEADRQAGIQRLLTELAADSRDPQVLSDLADAYLAGSSAEDLRRAAVALQVLLAVDPQDRSAYRRLITAYLSAADWADAQAATDSYAGIAGEDDPDMPFFRGLIAFRQGEREAAVTQFDRFLELAPDDPRATMVSSLRAEAAGELPGSSVAPGS